MIVVAFESVMLASTVSTVEYFLFLGIPAKNNDFSFKILILLIIQLVVLQIITKYKMKIFWSWSCLNF